MTTASSIATDWNDLAAQKGLEPVRRGVQEAVRVVDPPQWPDPILPGMTKTPEIPADILPSWLGAMAGAIADSTQTPPALAVGSCLAVLATVLQGRFEAAPYGDGYREPLAIWFMGAAPSGARKTAVQGAALAPLVYWEKLMRDRMRIEIARANSARAVAKKRIERLLGDAAKATFGGIGPLFSKLGSVLTIGRVAIGGVAAAVGALGYAFVKGYEESERFQKSVVLTGNAAGLTEGAFNALAGSVARSSGATIGSSREILQLLVETGQFGPQAIGEVAIAAAALAKVTGRTEQEVVKDFAGMSAGVAKWAADHTRSRRHGCERPMRGDPGPARACPRCLDRGLRPRGRVDAEHPACDRPRPPCHRGPGRPVPWRRHSGRGLVEALRADGADDLGDR